MRMFDVVMILLERGAPSLLVSFGRPFFSVMTGYYFMCKLLPNRLNICKLISLSLVYALWFNLRTPALLGTGYHLWMTIFINVWTPFILIFLFKGRFWRRVIVYWYFDIIKAICEAIALVPFLLYHAHRGFRGEWAGIVSSVELSAMPNLFYTLVFLSLFLLFGFLSLKIWHKLLLHKFQPFYLLFILLPLGQMYSLALVIHPNMGNPLFGIALNFASDVDTLYYIFSLFGISLSLVADVAILYYLFSYSKRAVIEAELRETKRIMELEQSQYRELEQSREELEKIRHDFSNQLASITRLIRSGEDGPARELLDSLGKEINKAE